MTHQDIKERLHGVAFTTATPFSEDGERVLHDEYGENLEAIEDARRRSSSRVGIPANTTR